MTGSYSHPHPLSGDEDLIPVGLVPVLRGNELGPLLPTWPTLHFPIDSSVTMPYEARDRRLSGSGLLTAPGSKSAEALNLKSKLVQAYDISIFNVTHCCSIEATIDVQYFAANSGRQFRTQKCASIANFFDSNVAAEWSLRLVSCEHFAEVLDT